MKPVAILIYVEDTEEGFAWYQKALPNAKVRYFAETDFFVLESEGVSVEIVRADEKVGSGKNGTVVYWSVESIDAAIARLVSIGAKIYRGPMKIENNQSMCQLEDPFGNLIGLRGSST